MTPPASPARLPVLGSSLLVLKLLPALVLLLATPQSYGQARPDDNLNGFTAVDPACLETEKPENYDNQRQQDFLLNYYALSATMSAMHSAVPYGSGQGIIGLDLALVPPLSCERRMAKNFTKSEATNKSPVIPRLVVGYAMPLGQITRDGYPVVLYGGAGAFPPLPVPWAPSTRALSMAGELGLGVALLEIIPGAGRFSTLEMGVRVHSSVIRVVGDLATRERELDEDFLDVYVGNTLGADLMLSLSSETRQRGLDDSLQPYLAIGLLDASSFFWIGDDSVVVDNLHPYFGPAGSLGLDGEYRRLHIAFELYAAPGGHSRPDPGVGSARFGSSGHLYTVRLRVALRPRPGE